MPSTGNATPDAGDPREMRLGHGDPDQPAEHLRGGTNGDIQTAANEVEPPIDNARVGAEPCTPRSVGDWEVVPSGGCVGPPGEWDALMVPATGGTCEPWCRDEPLPRVRLTNRA
jgi:hypothetical protein